MRRFHLTPAAALLLAWTCGASPVAQAAGQPIAVQKTITLNSVGDGRVQVILQPGADDYSRIKANDPRGTQLLQELGPARAAWLEVQNLRTTFNDERHTITLAWTVRGLARPGQDGGWEIPADVLPLSGQPEYQADRVRLPATFGRLPFSVDGQHLAFVTATDVVLPPLAHDPQLLLSPARLGFQVPMEQAEGGRAAATLVLHARPHLIPALAKMYGNPSFADMWLGRTVFTNTGDQTLRNYRLRFRIGDYGTPEWSPWKELDLVLPGQTVVDAYFPILDSAKLARRTDPAPVDLEVEYEYDRLDGTHVHKTAAQRLEVLGFNQVVYSDLPRNEWRKFEDAFSYGPAIAAAYVNGNDPVMQRIAGLVCRQLGGSEAAYSDAEALKFMEGLWDFLVANQIVYESPRARQFQQQVVQDIKYPRDVLRDGSGTCIELAFLYASVCEAAGLKPVVYLIPGHCFPAVRLPVSGTIRAVEVTKLQEFSFPEAMTFGTQEMYLAKKDQRFTPVMSRMGGLAAAVTLGMPAALPWLAPEEEPQPALVYEMDLSDYRQRGYCRLDLPAGAERPESWGIHATPPAAKPSGELTGTWSAVLLDSGVLFPAQPRVLPPMLGVGRMELHFDADGNVTAVRTDADGKQTTGKGHYRLSKMYGYTVLSLTFDDDQELHGQMTDVLVWVKEGVFCLANMRFERTGD